MAPSSERILFLYLNTGGGHLGPAKALSAQIRQTYGDDAPEIIILDAMPGTSSWQRTLVEKGYWFSSTVVPFLWGLIYHASRIPLVTAVQLWYARQHGGRPLARVLTEHKITKVVNFHFLVSPPIDEALQLLGRPDLPWATVVCDPFSLHPTWSYRNRSKLIALSDQAGDTLRKQLQRQRLDPAQVSVAGPIVSPPFAKRLEPDEVRRLKIEYGFDPERPLVLLAGGAGGLPRAERFLKGLCRSGWPVQVALVCGHNDAQKARAARITQRWPQAKVTLYSFVPFMYELMNMADVILTKAGASTVFEILSLHKPLIITSYLYGQERGNVDYVVSQGYGWYAPRVNVALRHIDDLLRHPERRQAMAEAIAHRTPTNGTERLARFVVEEL